MCCCPVEAYGGHLQHGPLTESKNSFDLHSCQDIIPLILSTLIVTSTLIGFSPRLHAHDPDSGAEKYLKWQHTWWNGEYSIILTKACFLHKKYLTAYFEVHYHNCLFILFF